MIPHSLIISLIGWQCQSVWAHQFGLQSCNQTSPPIRLDFLDKGGGGGKGDGESRLDSITISKGTGKDRHRGL